MEKLQRAQKLMKLAKQKDYYKILGVPRTANKKDIKKAYRKLGKRVKYLNTIFKIIVLTIIFFF